jgi:hypothetical protein
MNNSHGINRLSKSIFLILGICLCHSISSQNIYINEIVSDNELSYIDVFGEASDWIEIYNKGNEVIQLSDFYLSDNSSQLKKWKFPDISIAPKEFLMIIASDKDLIQGGEIHSNFKISADGESLFLSDNQGTIIDKLSAISLAEDMSYARVPDGGDIWEKTHNSTPGKTNNENNIVTSDIESGFYTESFSLTLEEQLGDEIYYTLDGSIPSSESFPYVTPIDIKDVNNDENTLSEIPNTPAQNLIVYKAWESPQEKLSKGNVVRFASFRNGQRNSPIYTKTYFVGPADFYNYPYPVISLTTDENNFFSDASGIYVTGDHYDPDNPEWSGNCFQKGIEWERDVHFSYFDEKGDYIFSQDAGIRTHGGKTRHSTQKSLRLYARNSYGKEYFEYPFFDTNPIQKYKRLLLRTTMGAWNGDAIIKDAFIQEIARPLDLHMQDYRPVMVFLNGEFWGMHSLREKVDEWFLAGHTGIEKEDINRFNWEEDNHYFDMVSFMQSNDLSDPSNYAIVNDQMDIANFIDYIIIETYFRNIDWPCNNNEFWRPEIEGGKWKWIIKDLDAAFDDYERNMFLWVLENELDHQGPHCANEPFVELFDNETFRQQFYDRYIFMLDNFFSLEDLLTQLEMVKGTFQQGMADHITRWNYPESISSWKNDISDDMIVFMRERSCIVRKQLHELYGLDSSDDICNIAEIQFEEIKIGPNPTSDVMQIICKNGICFIKNIELYDALGRKVLSKENIIVQSLASYDISNLASGLYYLKMTAEDDDFKTIPISIF